MLRITNNLIDISNNLLALATGAYSHNNLDVLNSQIDRLEEISKEFEKRIIKK